MKKMNYELLEYLTDKFSEIYDFYEDEEVQAVRYVDGYWHPSSFGFLSDTILQAIIDGHTNFSDEDVEQAMNLKLHIEDGLDQEFDKKTQNLTESIQYLAENASTNFEKYFWNRQLENE